MKKENLKKFIPFIVLIVCFVILPITFARYEQIINKKITINVRKPNYIVYFNSNRDDGNPDDTTSQSFVYGTSQTLTANSFTNGSETFSGWNTERDGSGTAYVDEEEVLNLSSTDGDEIYLYAQWGDAEYWVTYHFGDQSFGGLKYINTGIGLFSSANVNRDFEISMDVSNFTYLAGQDVNRNVILCNQNETGEPYQGFAFHYRDNVIKTQVNSTKVPNVQKNWGKTSGNIKFTRTNNVFYQDGETVYNFANEITPFAAPLSIGANLDVNGNPRRYSKVDLSNITIKLKYTYQEYSTLFQNLPNPEISTGTFDGWYTALEGGTKITSQAGLESAGGDIYVHWNHSTNQTITFYSNNGLNATTTQTVPYDVSTALDPNTFTYSGYRFVGWSETPDGNGTRYEDEGLIKTKESVNLYAMWKSSPRTSYSADRIVFNGNYTEIVDTGMYLFDSTNIHKNFIISFDIESVGSNNVKQATLLNSKDESGAPYPGFVIRMESGKIRLKGDSTASNSYYIDKNINDVQNLRLVRINDVVYYSYDNAAFTVLMDYSNIVRTFDEPVALGGLIRPNGSRDRAFKGVLSNISISYLDDNATLADFQSPSPSPSPAPAPSPTPSNPDGNNSVDDSIIQNSNDSAIENTNTDNNTNTESNNTESITNNSESNTDNIDTIDNNNNNNNNNNSNTEDVDNPETNG